MKRGRREQTALLAVHLYDARTEKVADLEVSTLEKFAAALPAQKILSFHQRPAQAQPPARAWMHLRCLHSLAGAWNSLNRSIANTALRQSFP